MSPESYNQSIKSLQKEAREIKQRIHDRSFPIMNAKQLGESDELSDLETADDKDKKRIAEIENLLPQTTNSTPSVMEEEVLEEIRRRELLAGAMKAAEERQDHLLPEEEGGDPDRQ